MLFVTSLGVIREGEEAVLEQDDAFDAFFSQIGLLEHFEDLLGQNEAGHHVGQHEHFGAKKLFCAGFAVFGTGEGGDGIGVAVIDESEGQNGVQNGLNASSGRVRVRHRCPLLRHHVRIRHRL